MLLMLYKDNIITQTNGLEYTETKPMIIIDFEQFKQVNAELVKYSTTDDIMGFSWNGRRKEEDYDTTFALYNTLKIVNKNDPLPSIFQESSTESDQYTSDLSAAAERYIRFTFDNTQRMRVYMRYPTFTIMQGLSRTGGLLAILNIVGIVCLFAH